MTTETEAAADAVRKRPGRKTNAERAAMQANATSESTELTTTATEAAMAVPDESQALTPLEVIQGAIDQIPESQMASWAIDILCKATLATQYRPVFRAAAEQKGEAGVYRLLQVMTMSCDKKHHNQLCMAASQSVSSARTTGKAILSGELAAKALPATEMANKVAYAAKSGCRLQDLATVAGPIPVERE